MVLLEQKIKKISDDIYETKTKQKRSRKFDKYLKEWGILRLTSQKRNLIKELFQKYNLQILQPYTEKVLNIDEIDKNDNVVIRYTSVKDIKEITQKKAENTNRPIFNVAEGTCPKSPYSFQEEAYKALNKFYTGNENKSGLLILPTGAGKTFTAVSWILRHIINNKQKVIWVAHRHELLEQVKNEIGKLSYSNILPNRKNDKISVHLISGYHDRAISIDKDDEFIIASVQTLNRNLDRLYNRFLKHNDKIFFVIDEAHHATANTYRALINKITQSCKKVNILGLTATPYRTAEKEKSFLSKIFDPKPIYKKDLRDLIINGILAEPKFVSVDTKIDFKKEDFTNREIELLQSNFDLPEQIKQKIVQRKDRDRLIVEHYLDNKDKYKKTLVFALDQDHAIQLDALFKEYGVKSNFIISGTQNFIGISIDKEYNRQAIRDYKDNKLELLVNVNILTEGTDLPKTQTVFLTRPTKSKTLMTQMVGRALRGTKAGGTKDAYIVSFIDNWGDLVAWQSPSELFVDEYDFQDATKDYRKYEVQFISIKLLQQFAKLADKTIDTEAFKNYPALMRIPLGWYSFEIVQKINNEDVDYKSCKILVYEQHKEAFDELNNTIDDLYKRFDYNKNNILEENELQDLLAAIKTKIFDNIEYPEPIIQDNDLSDLLRYYDEHKTMPVFFTFKDREKYDISLLANEIINRRLNPVEQAKFIKEQWFGENGKSIWQDLYGKFEFFKNDIDIEIGRILYYDMKPKTIDAPKVEYKKEKLQDLPLNQWTPEEYNLMVEAVYEKWNREHPDNQITKEKRKYYDIDHIKSRNDGGKTVLENLRPLLRSENKRKGTKSE